MDTSFFQSEIFIYFILPLLIFLARIFDVTIGTIRIILVSKGRKNLAPYLGFFEVLIWILAISRIMQNLNNPICYIAYAGGFAAGNYIGMMVEEKIALGDLLIRIITQKEANYLIKSLHQEGYGTTSIDASGTKGRVHIIFSIIKRAELKKVVDMINDFNPNAFYSIEDLRLISHGIFPVKQKHPGLHIHPLKHWKKGK